MLLRRVAVRRDGLKTAPIGVLKRDCDPRAHAADSHAQRRDGIPKRDSSVSVNPLELNECKLGLGCALELIYTAMASETQRAK
jgi:hypothetical protein